MTEKEKKMTAQFFVYYRRAVRTVGFSVFAVCMAYLLFLFFIGKSGEESLLRKWCFHESSEEEEYRLCEKEEIPSGILSDVSSESLILLREKD